MRIFNIDFKYWVWQQLPVRLRQPLQYAWLKCLVSPVVYLKGLFDTNRANNLYNVAHNSQVCYMQAMLNDAFDMQLRRIYIADPVYIDPLPLYRRSEQKPVYIGRRSEIGTQPYAPQWLYRRSEIYAGGGVQFIVNVPAVVYAGVGLSAIQAKVNEYRLAGKNIYSIVTF